jgi:glycosyltransferase involved in cell wall biosynthesis
MPPLPLPVDGLRRIGVSAHGTRGRASGLGHYLRNLLAAWLRNLPDLEIHLFCAHGEAEDFQVPGHERMVFHLAGPWSQQAGPDILWHHLVLPWKARALALEVLFIAVDRRLPLLSPVPVVATVHDLAAWAMAGKYAVKQQLYSRHAVPFLLRHTRHLIAVSEHTRRDLGRWAGVDPEDVTVVHHGVDLARFTTQDPDRQARTLARYGIAEPYLLYPARLEHPGKNHVTAVAALAHLRRRGEPLPSLVFAGSPWRQSEEILALIAKEGLEDRVTITGFIPDEELVDLYHGATAMLYPSRYEGFGMPLVEAMAAGLPIICSTAACLPEVVGDAGILVDPEDAAAFAEAVARLLGDAALRDELRERGLRRARLFDWDRAAAETMAVLHQAAQRIRPTTSGERYLR